MGAIAGKVMIRPRGDYDPSAIYDKLDLVKYDNKPWLCRRNNIMGIAPSTDDPANWMNIIDVSIANADTLDGHNSDYFATADHKHSAGEVDAVPTTRKVNGKPLSSDVSLNASDVGAAESNHTHAYADRSHGHSTSDITSGIFGPERGGTGNTTLRGALNAMINALSEGNTTPKDDDYYICQKAGGGTTETGYYRRPISYLWSYIKAKADLLYAAISHEHKAADITSGYLAVARGGTGVVSIASGNAVIGNGTGSVTSRPITDLSAKGSISLNTNLVTAKTVGYHAHYRFNRNSAVNAADANYDTYMARGIALVDAVPSSMVNGTAAFVYK